jgi:predicted AlkP superfamily phosphohydrolase/phosphomutase
MTHRLRFLVIGLDGATPELTWRWAEEGKLPHLARLIRRGASGRLHSTYPPISAAAWVTFMTGQNPGRHGIFDFRNYAPWKYTGADEAIVSSRPIAGHTVWDVVGGHGRRVAAVTVPITYPAWEVNGALVSGYPTPDSRTAYTYPPELAQDMRHLTEDSAFFRSRSPEEVVGELKRLARDRAAVSAAMLQRERYDLFVLVIGSTDRAQHDFWRHIQPDHPAHDPQEAHRFGNTIEAIYREADAAVGRLVEAAGEEMTVVVLSDHGGGARASRAFHTNAWLRTEGFLALKRGRSTSNGVLWKLYGQLKERFPYREQLYRSLPAPIKRVVSRVDGAAELGLDRIDWPRTQAYRFPMYAPVEGLVVNLTGRQAEGSVEPHAYERVRDELLDRLREARDPYDGRPLVREVWRREEIYAGEHVERAPDLIFILREGYEGGTGLEQSVTPVDTTDLRRLSGAHTMEGILIAAGPGVQAGTRIVDAHLMDLAPTLLHGMGLPVPRSMDGRVLHELFEPGFDEERAVERVDWQAAPASAGTGYSEEDERIVREQLRRLGYIE